MFSAHRARRWRLRRLLVLVVVALLGLTTLTSPVYAQKEDPDAALAAEEGGQEGASEQDSGSGSSDLAEAGEETVEPEPQPAAEPRQLVANDDSVQVIETDSSAHPSVDVVVAVPPALAGELPAEAFSLTENGQVHSLDVAKLRDVIEVVVVIDTSGSMLGDPIAAATTAAADFVDSLDGDTRLAVVGFGATAQTEASFGASRDDVSAAIGGLVAGGETALYDALVVASNEFGDGAARRFVVVLSDGTDTASEASLDDAAAALEANGANLYAITLQSDDADFTGLTTLADRINGQVVAASDAAELSDTYAAIASRLTNQYRLTYESTAAGTAALGIAVDANGIIAVASGEVDLPGQSATAADQQGSETSPTAASSSSQIDTSNPQVTATSDRSGILESDQAIYVGAGIVFFGIALAIFLAMSAEPKGPSAFDRLNFKPSAVKRGGIASIADRASVMADRILEKQEKRGALDSKLERAGMDMRPGEYVMASVGVAVGFGAVGFVLVSPVAGAIALAVGVVGGRMYVGFKASRRQKAFGNQLGDTLMMIAGSLRSGHGIVESIDTVASQADAPTGEEFTRAVAEARIGRDMVDSLYDIADRTDSEDFIWVVRAIGINRELGGDLAEILDNVGETIRDRNRLRDQVRALSAEGKVSAMILFALPIVVGGWVRMSNPEYLDAMTSQTAGKGLMGFAIFALIMGGIWLKKLVKVDF